tara:strand:- start:6725 stop:7624 length:900 start_codon:yes stop_codon:yes gene_type:complete
MENEEYTNFESLVNEIYQKKFLTVILSMTFAILFLGSSFLLTKYYKSEAIMQIADSDNLRSNTFSAYSGIADLAGINVDNDNVSRTDFAIETITSRKFLTNFINEKRLIELFAMEDWDENTNVPLINANIYDEENNTWKRSKFFNKTSKPTKLEAYKKVMNNFEIFQDRDTGFIKVSYTHISPSIAKNFLDDLILSVNQEIKDKEVLDATKKVQYLNKEIATTEVSEIRNILSDLIKKELSVIALSKTTDEYLLKIIDPPFLPEEHAFPKRLIFFISGLLFGLSLMIIIALTNIIKKVK